MSLIKVKGSSITGDLPAISGASLTNLPAATSVAFPATQSASANANTLDDYEEGSWTPTVSATSGSITSYTVTAAQYTKIGRLVTIHVYFDVGNHGSASGKVKCTLPFTTGSTSTSASGGREIGHTGKGITIQAGQNVSFVTIANSFDGGFPVNGGYNFFHYTYHV
tara:strand:+ start:774 stop:1271 length:498 start_codon:yes stop_codon:yes gene_type:complete